MITSLVHSTFLSSLLCLNGPDFLPIQRLHRLALPIVWIDSCCTEGTDRGSRSGTWLEVQASILGSLLLPWEPQIPNAFDADLGALLSSSTSGLVWLDSEAPVWV